MRSAVCRLVAALVLAGCAAPHGATAPGGGAPPQPPVVQGVAPGGQALPPGRTPTAPADPHQHFDPLNVTTGRLLVTTLPGPVSGVTMRVWVWLPPQYDEPGNAGKRFPALMLYPGGSGVNHNSWVSPALRVFDLVAQGAAEGRLSPIVLVMPAMQLSEQLDTECADLPGAPPVGTFLATDVRAMVEANFRVRTDRAAWGAAGLSSGAYCAARVVFNHPDQYAAAAVLDGYFTIETKLPGGRDPAVRAQDPWELAVSAPPPVAVLLYAGEGADLVRAQGFAGHVRPPTQVELKVLPGGQHLTTDIARMVPDSLAYLSAHLAGPR